MTEKLLPCPFCGAEPRYFDTQDFVTAPGIICDVCNIEVLSQHAKRNAALMWNTRPADAPELRSCGEPPLTCPAIDAFIRDCEPSDEVVQDLENIRDANSQLRYGLWSEKERANELQAELDKLRAVQSVPDARNWISPVATVADLVSNLLTLDQDNPVYGAYFLPEDVKDRCRVRNLTISKERVENGRIHSGNADIPYSTVIWTALEPERSTAMTANPFDGLAERLDRVLVTDRNGEGFVLSTESAKNLAKTAETWVQSHAIIETCAAPPSAGNADAVRKIFERCAVIADTFGVGRQRHEYGGSDIAVRIRADAIDFLAALSSAPVAGEWQPIETAPKDGTPILAANSRHPTHAPVVVRWSECAAILEEPGWVDAATASGDALYHNPNYFDFWIKAPMVSRNDRQNGEPRS